MYHLTVNVSLTTAVYEQRRRVADRVKEAGKTTSARLNQGTDHQSPFPNNREYEAFLACKTDHEVRAVIAARGRLKGVVTTPTAAKVWIGSLKGDVTTPALCGRRLYEHDGPSIFDIPLAVDGFAISDIIQVGRRVNANVRQLKSKDPRFSYAPFCDGQIGMVWLLQATALIWVYFNRDDRYNLTPVTSHGRDPQ